MKQRWDSVRQMLSQAVPRVFPAAQLLVVDAGAPVLALEVGACDPATVFDLASLTKPLCTTTLVMRQIQAGRLALEDELRPGVTVRLALCHASGLPWWRPYYQLLAGAADPKAAVLAAVRAEPLEAPPGSRSVYSDLGFLLLGEAVERASGRALDEAWAALGISDATFHPDAHRAAPTEGHLRGLVDDDNARFIGATGVAGHAGLFGTAADVSRVAAELVAAWHGDEGRVVRPALVRSFWSPAGIAGSTWCLGWDRPSPSGYSSAGGQWSRQGVGHTGFTGTSLWIDPQRSRWVVLLTNRVHPSRTNESIRDFRPALHDAISAALGPQAASLHLSTGAKSE